MLNRNPLLILTQAEAFLSSKRPYVNYGELWLKRIPFGSYTKFRIQPQTTSIYNDYIDSLPLHAKGGGCVVGLTYSDNALFGKDDSSAVPMGGSLRSHTDRIAFLVPGDACRRGTAFGYEPGR